MQELDALLARIIEIAEAVVQERSPAYEGAKELWQLSSAIRGLPESLLPFVGLASEWEDHPDRRSEYDRDIVVEMERLRRTLST